MFEMYPKKPHLDNVTGNFIEQVSEAGGKPLYELTPEEAREFLLMIQRNSHKHIPAAVKDLDIAIDDNRSVNVRLVRPENYNDILPVIIYLHGGGWVMGDSETHDMLIRKLSVCTNSVVVFVNYSRSPEAVYPQAVNEIYGVLKFLYQNADKFNIDSDRIAIAGDSAGGNLATVVALKTLKEGGPQILLQALLYPVTDANMDSDSYKEFKDGPWLTKKAMEYFWNAYLPDKSYKNDMYVSPLRACVENLAGLPPALIITAENDVLRDEGEAYARKLDFAGVKVMNVRINMTCHDFMMLNDLQHSPAVKSAFALLCKVLSHKLHN